MSDKFTEVQPHALTYSIGASGTATVWPDKVILAFGGASFSLKATDGPVLAMLSRKLDEIKTKEEKEKAGQTREWHR